MPVSDICAICNSPRSDSAGPCYRLRGTSLQRSNPQFACRHPPTEREGSPWVGVLGEGGFGITYLGAHRLPEAHGRHQGVISGEGDAPRHHCFGVLTASSGNSTSRKSSVLEEARAITRLDSPYIVEVQDAFLENNTAYIVMEYLEGESLQERIDAVGALPPDDVHRIAMAVCDALTEVHRHHLLHRDIKPANIMLTRDGRVVLVDFGSARAFNHGRTVRHTRILTMDYAAPEMYSTQARFGPYTDLFCLGGALFHALTGRQPPSVMDRLQDGGINLEFPDALQGSLSTAIGQALQVRIEDRPPSVADFKAITLERNGVASGN